uniref:Uncharacterized protein LOC113792571 n=1 Tax=Dermatophagoides pteronyssinus TaxID=6956 RepID=A0A6P6XYL0_DERPT|nr:uncharacterized protein LOC113792571 [Dermatophagoides pteronyssinus]
MMTNVGNDNTIMMNNNNTPYPSPNELIHAILNGNICKGFPEPPSKLVKLFISSTRTDFEIERQHLHEIVLPKLERYCNSLSLDLLAIDPHWQLQPPPPILESCSIKQQNSCNNDNNGDKCSTINTTRQQQHQQQPTTVTPVIYEQNSNLIDPHEFDLQLKEIEECSQQSISTFFMCLIGHKYRPIALPTVIASNDFQQIFTAAAESGLGDVNLLRSCYKENRNLQPEPHYVLLEPRRASRQYEEELEHIAKLVEYGSKVAAREGLLSNNFGIVMSAVHQQTLHALYCARQYQLGGLVTSPTTMNITNRHHHHQHHYLQQQQQIHPLKSPPPRFPSSSCTNMAKKKILGSGKLGSLLTGTSTNVNINNDNSDQQQQQQQSSIESPKIIKKPSPPLTPTRHRLLHQVSLQQGPTQKKIQMTHRQTSVSTNYELMQQPVDRMLCFIRQLEGVNFNNASVTRFFDVTPTTMTTTNTTTTTMTTSSSDESKQQQQQQSLNSSLPIPSNNQQQTPIRQLYAPTAQNDIQQLIEDVILGLKKGNVHYFNISWSPPPDNSIQTRTYTLPANYIERFGEAVLRTLKTSIDEHWQAMQQSIFGPIAPGSCFEYPGDIVREAHSHLSNFRRVMRSLGMAQAINHSDLGHLLHIRELLIADTHGGSGTTCVGSANTTSSTNTVTSSSRCMATTGHQSFRHQPIIVTGRSGSGKSTLLAQVFTYAPDWLAENSDRDQVIRIVRQCGQSPSSNFASELLRSLCIQTSVAYGLESHLTRSASAHELSELAICFQELIRFRNPNDCDLLIILDDLHHLQSALQSSALLGWMPWHLPSNVHFICSVALESESVLSILRSRISAENFICLDNDHRIDSSKHCQSIYSMVQSKLRDEKRTLTSIQWDFVRKKINNSDLMNNNNNQRTEQQLEALGEMTPLFANILATAVLSNWESFYTPEYLPTNVNELVTTILDDLEDCIPYQLVRRICAYLTCTKYGLREVELFQLVQETLTVQIWPAIYQQQTMKMRTTMAASSTQTTTTDTCASSDTTTTPDPYDQPRSTSSTWIILKSKMRHLLKEYFVQGQLYYQWRSSKVAKAVQERYLTEIRQIRAIHLELATAFYNSFNELYSSGKESESVREADELWYHLLYSGNKSELKTKALLNIRFLNTIVQGVSVCYLRCILDAVRSQILDWDIEQLYAMLKQSVYVVTQEPNQLPVEVLLWLVPFASMGHSQQQLSLTNLIKTTPANLTNFDSVNKQKSQNKSHTLLHPTSSLPTSVSASSSPLSSSSTPSSHLAEFIRQCYRTCVESTDRPLLYPLNIWLNLPIPPQVTMITSPWPSITRAVSTPDSQHLIVCEQCSLHFYHLPTKTVARSLEGHKSTITCLHLSTSGKWLATGSDDSSVHLWYIDAELMEINDCRLRHRFIHHSASVLCITINHMETLVISGSENGAICAVNLHNGTLITRLEHHKSMVTCIGINSGDDVLVSGSTDRTVVVWSLDSFCILNEILLMRPVLHMDISLDSTFLLLSLDDNSLQIRALTTGTGVHTLQPSLTNTVTAVVSYVRFAEDNCRCVVGYADGRLLLFDLHSARQLQTLNGHSEMISSILPQKDDHFLFTSGGNKIIIWNFYPVRRVDHTSSALAAEGLDRSIHETNLVESMAISQGLLSSLNDPFMDNLSGKDIGKDSKESGTCGSSVGGGSGSGRTSRSSSDRRKHKTSSSSSTHGSFRKKVSVSTIDNHREPITCVSVARDGQYIVTGGRDCLVKIWLSATAETHTTLDESSAPITSVDISPNSQFIVAGGEDGQIRAWSLTLSMYLSKFGEHAPNALATIKILSDNKRTLSADVQNVIRLWQVDNGILIKVIQHKSINGLFVHGGTCFSIGGKIDNCLKYWQIFEPEIEKSVSHSDTITCFTCTHSGKTLITGSQDMSLKVWETSTGKLTQVLVGHEEAISCVATAALDEMLVVSGAQDCNLIVWDMNTGTDLFTLTGHNANILGVILTPDASRALSYSEDNTLQLWDIRDNGVRLSMLDVHHNISHVYSSLTVTYLAVWLGSSSHILPIIKHHNNSSQHITVELPAVGTPVSSAAEEKSSAWLRGLIGPSSRSNASVLASRTLKREQSFDSFYFEHMLHRGQSVDDFRKIGAAGLGGVASLASPFGSREQLWTGHQDQDSNRTIDRVGSTTRSRMISKLRNIGPKNKMLKKQQSMFACFPEFTGKTVTASGQGSVQDSGLSQQVNGAIGKKLIPGSKTKIFPVIGSDRSSTTIGTSTTTTTTTTSSRTAIGSRTGSQDKNDDDMDSMLMMKSNIGQNDQFINLVKDSSICRII